MLRIISFFLVTLCSISIFASKLPTNIDEVKLYLSSNAPLMSAIDADSESDIKYIEKLVSATDQSYVFKVMPSSLTPYVIKWVDNKSGNLKYEALMQKLAAEKNLAAKIYHTQPDNNLYLMEYLYKSKMPKSRRTIRLLQEFVNDIHMIPTSNSMKIRDMYDVLDENVKKLEALGDDIHPVFLNKLQKIAAQKEDSPSITSVFTHNALNLDNVFYYNNSVKAISWSDGGIGDPYYDIASIRVWYLPGMPDSGQFLSEYFGYPATQAQVERLMLTENLVKAVEASKLMLYLLRAGEEKLLPQMTGTNLRDYLVLFHADVESLDSNEKLARFTAMILNSIRL